MTGSEPDSSPNVARSGQRAAFRGAIRVRPGASRTHVGGHLGDLAAQRGPDESRDPDNLDNRLDSRLDSRARPALPPLLVAVTARATDGAATAAAERALAKALRVRPKQVAVVRGFTSRDKLVEVSDPDPQLPQRWRALLGLTDPGDDPA